MPGRGGAPAQEMKKKRAKAESNEHKRSDRSEENGFEHERWRVVPERRAEINAKGERPRQKLRKPARRWRCCNGQALIGAYVQSGENAARKEYASAASQMRLTEPHIH